MNTALAFEALKFRRARIARLTTVLAVIAIPGFSLGMVAIARGGLVTGPSAVKFAPLLEGTVAEAQMALAGQILTVGMVLATGILTAWLYGREWADHTIAGLFALPVSRRDIGFAKALICAGWVVVVVAAAMAVTLAGAYLTSPQGVSTEALHRAAVALVAGIIMGWLGLPFGYVAVVTRGYLGAVAGIIAVTAASQILASLGLGRWVPWVAPALWAGAGGSDASAGVAWPQLLVAVLAAAAGAVAAAVAMHRARLA